MKKCIVIFYFLILQIVTLAQPVVNKYEFRGVWIATIGNIDWPSSGKADAYTQQQEFINLLNTFKANNINAIIIQVRPTADAFYKSTYEGWSRYVVPKDSTPTYDPLQFIVAESHRRGIEVHAWFNPYRAQVFSNKNPHPYHHPTYTHPEWFVNYGGKKYFDPGIPAARKYVQDVVAEVVTNYDIDAVHFDDYFYPYKIGKLEFPDRNSFAKYGNGFYNKADWRRNNTDLFIQEMNTRIKKIKPYVKLGISPFGVWRNIANDADGSNTNAGVQNYDDLYADVIKWQRLGWIDYLMPQLYWERSHRVADYTTLTEWWNRHTYGRGMYIGQGLYQVGVNKASSWQNGNELPEQIIAGRNYKNINGYCLYSASHFYKNKYNVINNIKNNCFNTIAIVPPMRWLDSIAPPKPSVTKTKQNGTLLLTLKPNSIDTWGYVIYKFAKGQKIDITNGAAIEAVITTTTYFTKTDDVLYNYIVTSMDRNHNESTYVTIE